MTGLMEMGRGMGANIEEESGVGCCVGEDEGLVDMSGLMVKGGEEGRSWENDEVDETNERRKRCIAGESTMLPESKLMSAQEILQKKHPAGKFRDPSSLLTMTAESVFNQIIFENLDADLIRITALHMQGSAGPSGVDAFAWRRLCSSFGSASRDLCSALAAVGRRLCTSLVDPTSISAFVSCRLIPLDKCPGVRPIGVGEVPRRIIAKAILRIIGHVVKEAAGPLQVCTGQDGGCEAAVHAMRTIFKNDCTEGCLLVDASNAFNYLNRRAALHNVSVLCPPLSTVLINTYSAAIRMIVPGSGEILSTERTTQGNTLAMVMYTLVIVPLI